MPSLKPLRPSPSPLPSSGSLRGPKTSNATNRTRMRCVGVSSSPIRGCPSAGYSPPHHCRTQATASCCVYGTPVRVALDVPRSNQIVIRSVRPGQCRCQALLHQAVKGAEILCSTQGQSPVDLHGGPETGAGHPEGGNDGGGLAAR